MAEEKKAASLADLVGDKARSTGPKANVYVGMKIPTPLYTQLCEAAGVDVTAGGTTVFKVILTDFLKSKGIIE